MYMAVPRNSGENSSWSKESRDMTLISILSPLENKLSSADYSKIWQELMHSGKDLDHLYEESKSGTYFFKDKYDEIKKTENLNEALRQTYYIALAEKKKHEEDRDNYFKCDKDLAQMKEEFIEETQELALKNSKYIEYNQRFSSRREQLMCHMLDEVSKVHKENNKLSADKDRLVKELIGCRKTMYDQGQEIKLLHAGAEQLKTNCENLEQLRDQFKKEAEWMLRQNNKLKESNARLERDLSEAKTKLQKMAEKSVEQEKKEKDLISDNNTLKIRSEQTAQLFESVRQQLASVKSETEKERRKWEEEMKAMKGEVAAAQKRTEAARLNNHRTLMRNQQLREKLSAANHKIDKVSRDKLRTSLKEYKTRKTNVELATHQLELINEILELKNAFFKDQARIREGAKLNRKLEKNVEILRQRMELLKENPSAIDPLDGAKELRKQTLKKYGAKRTMA